ARLGASVADFGVVPRGLRRHFFQAYLDGEGPSGRRRDRFERRIREMAERLRKPPEVAAARARATLGPGR
ncbi:MAG: hypothetical protein ACE5JG_01475, partial [Planctomycetota bacterium]